MVPLCDSFVHLSDCTYSHHIVEQAEEESMVISLLSSSTSTTSTTYTTPATARRHNKAGQAVLGKPVPAFPLSWSEWLLPSHRSLPPSNNSLTHNCTNTDLVDPHTPYGYKQIHKYCTSYPFQCISIPSHALVLTGVWVVQCPQTQRPENTLNTREHANTRYSVWKSLSPSHRGSVIFIQELV